MKTSRLIWVSSLIVSIYSTYFSRLTTGETITTAMIFELLALFAALAIGWSYLKLGKRVQNFPPGPIGLPLLGHLPMLGANAHKTLAQWKKTYGPVIGVWFGSYRTVVINDAKLIREAMHMNTFSARPELNLFKAKSDDGIIRGVGVTNGSQWMEQRRFIQKNLKDFGLGTKVMEIKIQEEIHELMKSLSEKEGKPIQVKNLFDGPVLNALWSTMFGERMKNDNPDSKAAFRGLISIFDDSNSGTLAMFMPWLAKIAPKLSGFQKNVQNFAIVKSFLQKQIEIHNEHYVQNQPRDFIDAYTDEGKKTTDPNSSFHPKNDVLIYTLVDLFAGGAETTSTTMSWVCAYLIIYKQVQKKLQDEIDEVIGKERIPSLSDRSSMPYTEAVINEVMRFSSIFPLGVFRCATEDLDFQGFFIPKDTMILPNTYAVHFDETIWGDPQNFRPERFINSDGKFKNKDNLLPFSTGKRVCIGEGLARDELFLFTTNLFQTFCASEAGTPPSLEPHIGITLSPQPFEMILEKRLK